MFYFGYIWVCVGGNKYRHDIVIKKTGEQLQRVDSAHVMKEPLMYPLLFPKGTKGFGRGEYEHTNETTSNNGTTYHRKVTGHQYLKNRLFRVPSRVAS